MSRIVVLGAGESGAGAAILAKKEGFDVFVSDMSKIKDKYKKMLEDHQIEWEEGQHTEEKILNADEIIKIITDVDGYERFENSNLFAKHYYDVVKDAPTIIEADIESEDRNENKN